jgi:hypothetical protein
MGRHGRNIGMGGASRSPTYLDLIEYAKPLLEYHQRVTANDIKESKKRLTYLVEKNQAESYLELKNRIKRMLLVLDGITDFATFTHEEVDLGIPLPEIEYFNPTGYPGRVRIRINGICPDKHGGFFRMDCSCGMRAAAKKIEDHVHYRIDHIDNNIDNNHERMEFRTFAKGRVWPAEADADIGGERDSWKALALYLGHYMMHGQLVKIRTNALIDHMVKNWKKTLVVRILGEKYLRLRKIKGKKGNLPILEFFFENSQRFNVNLPRRTYYTMSVSGNHVWSGQDLLFTREAGTDKVIYKDPV